MEPISIEYQLTKKEFLQACNYHWNSHKVGIKSMIILGIVGIALGSILICLKFLTELAVAFVILSIILLILPLIRHIIWQKSFDNNKKFHNKTKVVFDDNLLHVKGALGSSELKWDIYSNYLETPEYVLLYMTKRNFSVIPKYAFESQYSLTSFINLVKSKLKQI